jgi:hypothetical protein
MGAWAARFCLRPSVDSQSHTVSCRDCISTRNFFAGGRCVALETRSSGRLLCIHGRFSGDTIAERIQYDCPDCCGGCAYYRPCPRFQMGLEDLWRPKF